MAPLFLLAGEVLCLRGAKPHSPLQNAARRGLHMASPIQVDVAVIGGGIAGTTISWLLQDQQNCSVLLIDPKVDVKGAWYPNYGMYATRFITLSFSSTYFIHT